MSVRKTLVTASHVSEKRGLQQLFSNWFLLLPLLCTAKLKANSEVNNSCSWKG